MKTICKRDLMSFFHSPLGYVYVGVFALIGNLVFFAQCVLSSSSDVTSAFAFLLTVLLFMTPMLTMRLFSEEYRQGTDKLLLTAPIGVKDIVLGKFLCAMALIGCCLLTTLPWLVILILGGTPAWAGILGCYAAIIFAAAVFAAMGLFLSSLTESQLIAAVLSFALFLGLYLADVLSSAADGVTAAVLEWLSVFSRYDEFLLSRFSLGSILYFITLTALFLFLTVRVVERRRAGVRGKSAKNGLLLSSASVLLAVAAVVLFNLVCTELDSRFGWTLDLTAEKLYSISQDTEDILNALEDDVTITVLADEDAMSGDTYASSIRLLLQKYDSAGKRVTVRYIDPYKNPAIVEAYAEQSADVTEGTTIIECGDRRRILNMIDYYDTEADSSSGYSYITAFRGENTLTSSILSVTSEQTPSAYVLRGHSESISTQFNSMLESSGYTVDTLVLNSEPIPDDTSLLLLSLPQADYTEDEISILDEYVKAGGDLLVLDGTDSPAKLPILYGWLREWGIRVQSSMVLDSNYNLGDERNIMAKLTESSISDALSSMNDRTIIAPDAKPMTVRDADLSDRTVETLLTTCDTAYARPLSADTVSDSYAKRKGDTDGPFALAAMAQYTGDTDGGQLFVCSSALMITDQLMQTSSLLNKEFFRSALSSMQPDIDLLDIPSRSLAAEPLILGESAIYAVFLVLLFVPLFLFGYGFLVFLRRRTL